jgi:hypothetical protein
MKRTLALGIAGAAVAVAGVGGVAYATDSSTPAASSSAAPDSAGTAPRHHRALAGRALHGQFTVERKGQPAVVDVQRGEVTKVDPTSITVRSTDGFEATYARTPSTKVREKKAAAPAGDLVVGKKVGVVADDANGHPTARAVRILPAR